MRDKPMFAIPQPFHLIRLIVSYNTHATAMSATLFSANDIARSFRILNRCGRMSNVPDCGVFMMKLAMTECMY